MLYSQETPTRAEFDALDTPKRTRMDLPLWTHDPVARNYRMRQALHTVELVDHPAFVSIGLHISQEHAGGAIIHVTDVYTVLALEYDDQETLSEEWHTVLRHYGKWSPVAQLSMRRLEIA